MNDAHRAMFNLFAQPDPHANGVMKMLEELYPAFARKLFQGNRLMRAIVLSGYSPLDILDYPICGRCETPAAWNGVGIKDGKLVEKCTCLADKCGADTLDPILLRDWMAMELKRKAPPEIADVAEHVVDELALQMMMMAQRAVDKEVQAQQGIVMPDGSMKRPEPVDARPAFSVEERPIEDEELESIAKKEWEALPDV